MNRSLGSVMVALGLTLGVASAAPKAVFPEKVHEAGDVQLGETIVYEFAIRNDGDEPFRITEVHPSCHCTVPEYPPVVAPGKSEKIIVKINTNGLRPERTSKNVTVATDAPGGERTVLAVNFNLATPLEFLPNALVYVYQKQGESKQQQVLARPHVAGMKILSVQSDNPLITVSLQPVTAGADSPGGGAAGSLLLPRAGDAWVTVKLSDQAPPGAHKAELLVKTTDPKNPQGTIVVRAKVEPKTP